MGISAALHRGEFVAILRAEAPATSMSCFDHLLANFVTLEDVPDSTLTDPNFRSMNGKTL